MFTLESAPTSIIVHT